MNNRREILTGIIAALISMIILVGSLALASIEGSSTVAINISETPTSTSYPTQIIVVTQRPGEPTYTPSPTVPSPTPTVMPPTSCPPPAGWSPIVVQPGDTIDSIAQTYNTTSELIKQANCLVGNNLVAGTIIYVPGAPPPTSVPCGPPPWWVYYIVQPGDTLYSIGRAYGVSVSRLQAANCLGSSTNIRVGQRLYVPNVPTVVPSRTPTLVVTPTPVPSATSTRVPSSPTATWLPPSITPAAPPTLTATSTPATTTQTPTPTATGATLTPLPSVTPALPTMTETPVPVPPTATATPAPQTNTPTPNPTR